MGIHVEYVKFKPNEKSQIDMSKLYHRDAGGGSYYSGELGFLIEAAFRGIKEDIDKVVEITGEQRVKQINDIVYELYVRGDGANECNKVFDAIQEVPGCKVALYFCSKWESETVGSMTGYSYITYKQFRPDYHEKENDWPWNDSVKPHEAWIEWDALDYVVEIDGQMMQMSTSAKQGDVEVEFIEGGARITAIHPKKRVVTIPETVKGEYIIEVDKWSFNKKDIEVRSPYISINEWPDKESRKLLVLGYARGVQAGVIFTDDVIQKNNKYIKSQRKRLFDIAVTDQALLKMMFDQKIVTLEDIPVLIEKVNEVGNAELVAMIIAYRDENFTAEDSQKLAERQLKKELEYDPLSPSELKKQWKTIEKKDGTLEIVSYKGSDTEIFVPDTIGEARVTSIAEGAFSVGQKGVTKDKKVVREKIAAVVIPDSIKQIGKNAFCGCVGLKSVKWPKNTKKVGDETFKGCVELISFDSEASIEKIGAAAFYGCKKLSYFSISSSIKSIGISAFEGCEAIETITVCAKLKEIKDSVFKDCTSLKEVVIENGITVIGDNAFKGCSLLSTVEIPISVTVIGRSAFEKCGLLTKIGLPSGIIEIKDATFAECLSLQEIFIPNGVKTIGRKAFNKCKRLQAVHIPETIAKISDMAFYGCIKLRKVMIPNTTIQIGWDAFPKETEIEK